MSQISPPYNTVRDSEKLLIVCAPLEQHEEITAMLRDDMGEGPQISMCTDFAEIEIACHEMQARHDAAIKIPGGIPPLLTNVLIYHDPAFSDPQQQQKLGRVLSQCKEQPWASHLSVTIIWAPNSDMAFNAPMSAALLSILEKIIPLRDRSETIDNVAGDYEELIISLDRANVLQQLIINPGYGGYPEIHSVREQFRHAYATQYFIACAPQQQTSEIEEFIADQIGGGASVIVLQNVDTFSDFFNRSKGEGMPYPPAVVIYPDCEFMERPDEFIALIRNNVDSWADTQFLVIQDDSAARPGAAHTASVRVSEISGCAIVHQLHEFVKINEIPLAGLRHHLLRRFLQSPPDDPSGGAAVSANPIHPIRGGGICNDYKKYEL